MLDVGRVSTKDRSLIITVIFAGSYELNGQGRVFGRGWGMPAGMLAVQGPPVPRLPICVGSNMVTVTDASEQIQCMAGE